MLQDLLKAGLREHQAGRLPEAKKLYEQALRLDPRHPDALNLAGVLALQDGDASRAAELLQRAVEVQPRNPGFRGNLAQAFMAGERYAEALAAYQRAARLDRFEPQFAVGAASCLALQGRAAEAERQLRAVIRHHPGFANAWFNLGNVVRDQARPDEAVDCYRRVIGLEPGFPDVHNNLGNVLHLQHRLDEAERCYREHLARQPDSVMGYCNLVSVLIDRGKFAEAEATCSSAIATFPQSDRMALLQQMRGSALAGLGRFSAALPAFRAAAELEPGNARALWALGHALFETGNRRGAQRYLERALALQPDAPEWRHRLSGILLSAGDWQAGWREHEFRPARSLQIAGFPDLQLLDRAPDHFSGRTVCLLPEQGLGDQIFFLRYATALKSRGARVTCVCHPKITSLLGRAAALDHVYSQSDRFPEADDFVLMGSVAHVLGRFEAASLPTGGPADAGLPRLSELPHLPRIAFPEIPPPLGLPPSSDRLADIERRLAASGPPPYVGLTWRAGTPHEQHGATWLMHKEIAVEALGDAVKGVNGTLIALQRNPGAGEIQRFAAAAGRAVHDFTDLNEDLESMLALLTLIDDYIGVSNTNMHLRAGTGRPARILVPRPAEWRWMAAGNRSPWFPGFHLYRQQPDGDWRPALARLNRDLLPSGDRPR